MPFNFNIHSSLLLPCVIQGLLYFILFLIRSKREDSQADFYLALLTFWSTTHVMGWMLGFAGWYESYDGFTQFMFYYPFSLWFFLGPLIYFFVKAKTNTNFRLSRKDYKHWILPAISLLWIFVCFFIDIIWKQTIMGETLAEHKGTRGAFAQNPYGMFAIPLISLRYFLLFYYVYLSIQHYRKYRNYIVSELSIADQVDFRWVRNILYAFSFTIVFWFCFDNAGLFLERNYVDIWWGYLFWGIIIFYITISGYQDNSHINTQIAFDPDAKKEMEEKEELPEVLPRIPLQEAMLSKKSYLKSNLNLSDFARELKVTPAQLSKIINSEYNQNFNEFVNGFRVDEVIGKLKNEDFSHYSILGIALESGFNSKATFNRVFKAKMGMSPSQYKQSIPDKK